MQSVTNMNKIKKSLIDNINGTIALLDISLRSLTGSDEDIERKMIIIQKKFDLYKKLEYLEGVQH